MLVPGFYPSSQMDEPVVLDLTATAVPGKESPTLQIVAIHARDSQKIRVHGSVGCYIGVYRGAVGFEKRVCTISPGGHPCTEDGIILKGERISVRNLETGACSEGSFSLQFLSSLASP